MPIIPSVFQPIRANDYQQRPVKTYKRYKVGSTVTTASGYYRHNAVYRRHTPHILATDGSGIADRNYPVNAEDKTNQHVVWNVIDHKYYRNNNPAAAADFIGIDIQHRFLWHSGSMFTAPYGQVGEKIKHGTFKITSSIGNTITNLADDGNGNLRDPFINTSSFASSSNTFFYMSTNDMYRKFNDCDELGVYTGPLPYKLNSTNYNAIINTSTAANSIKITSGIHVTSSTYQGDSGLSIEIPNTIGTNIRIPHSDKFDRFGKCDDWTISFWHYRQSATSNHGTILSKYGMAEEAYLDKRDKKRKTRLVEVNPVTSLVSKAVFESEKVRTPFHILSTTNANNTTVQYKFIACDGIQAVEVNSGTSTSPRRWDHICVRNKTSKLEVFVNGATGSGGTHGVLPNFTTNAADVVLGNTTTKATDGGAGQRIAELRMYDYAVDSTALTSLGNNHYLSGSCYQTNVAGNVFYKNGQAVASSHLPKYNSGSGIFGNTWTCTYRGTHTIYENECLVRVPKDQFNVTMNPTTTYRPVTVGVPCHPSQSNLPPGELRKGLFVSGTLKPYITTIGLYNDKAEMLAAAKLAQPIQKNPDVDMNFVIRWDY